MAKRKKNAEDFIHHLYIHMNAVNNFVIFSGITLRQFVSSSKPLNNLLLLKHSFEDGSFNMHTLLDFVSEEDIPEFVKKMNDSKDDLCWVDFVDEKKVNQLTPMEQAELLYLSHKKEPIHSPFFSKLQNNYAYYSSTNEKMTKVYFRDLKDCELLLSNLFNKMIKNKEVAGSFWRKKSKQTMPSIDSNELEMYRPFIQDGALLSLFKIEKMESTYGIEIRTLSDYEYPDEVWDDLKSILNEPYDDFIEIS